MSEQNIIAHHIGAGVFDWAAALQSYDFEGDFQQTSQLFAEGYLVDSQNNRTQQLFLVSEKHTSHYSAWYPSQEFVKKVKKAVKGMEVTVESFSTQQLLSQPQQHQPQVLLTDPNQQKLIEDQRQLIQDKQQLIEDQRELLRLMSEKAAQTGGGDQKVVNYTIITNPTTTPIPKPDVTINVTPVKEEPPKKKLPPPNRLLGANKIGPNLLGPSKKDGEQ